jgi:hypothetical protein
MKQNNWGGVREESEVIEYYADKWCKDNGYPVQRRKYVYKGKWIKNKKDSLHITAINGYGE